MSEVPGCVKAFAGGDVSSMHVRVVARVRPSLPSEVNKLLSFISTDANDLNATVDSDRYQEAVRVLDSTALEVTMPKEKKKNTQQSADPYTKKAVSSHRTSVIQPKNNDGATTNRQSVKKIYDEFDYVCGAVASQEQVFRAGRLPELIEAAVAHGFSGTVFAYGQTGSGKTYTMSGVEEKIIKGGFTKSTETDGLIPRGLAHIFNLVRQLRNDPRQAQYTYKVRTSFLEIYNETVIDLINKADRKTNGKALHLRQQPKPKIGFFVDNLLILEAPTLADVMAVAAEGHQNRRVASHDLNADSSRSHSIFTVYIDKLEGDVLKYTGKINFVDLAGSENLKQSKSRGGNAKETGAINKSLFTLGAVISTLCDISQKKKPKSTHVPYRDSVLTKLLMDALGGGGLTAMIACVSPLVKHGDETHRTLQYAVRAKNIEVRPSVKVNTQQDKYEKLVNEVRRLQGINLGLEKFITQHGLTVPAELSASGATSQRTLAAKNIPAASSFFASKNQNSSRAALMTSPSDAESDFFIRRVSNNNAWARHNADSPHVSRPSSMVSQPKNQNNMPSKAIDRSELERENDFLREKIKNLENMFLKRRPSGFLDASPSTPGGGLSRRETSAADTAVSQRSSRQGGGLKNANVLEQKPSERELRIKARSEAPKSSKGIKGSSRRKQAPNSNNGLVNQRQQAPVGLYTANVSSANRRKGQHMRTSNPVNNFNSPTKANGSYADSFYEQPNSRRRPPRSSKSNERGGGYGYGFSEQSLTPNLDVQIARMEQEKDQLTERLVSSGRGDHRSDPNSRRQQKNFGGGIDSGRLKGKQDRAPRRSASTTALRGGNSFY